MGDESINEVAMDETQGKQCQWKPKKGIRVWDSRVEEVAAIEYRECSPKEEFFPHSPYTQFKN